MTLPHEEKQALICAGEFLKRLTHPVWTKDIPLKIRKGASLVLRHYPGPSTIKNLYNWRKDK